MNIANDLKKSILNELANGGTFIGEYEIIKQLIEFNSSKRIYIPYYKILKIRKVDDNFIIEAPSKIN